MSLMRMSRHAKQINSRWLSSLRNPVEPEWQDEWIAATDFDSDVTYDQSADQLRQLIRTGLLRFTDLKHNPERFFEAHRLLARHAVEHGPGFWIRFTVQYNLFAGTVVAAGTDEQIDILDRMQDDGALGCFGLTEKLAGVQSGLVVQTTATWDESTSTFILNTPSLGAVKNWISQGATADNAVVLADLLVGGESKGPHAFLMDLRVNKTLTEGVTLVDMGGKTTGNDLDNVSIHFGNVVLPSSALLSKHAHVSGSEYVRTSAKMPPFAMIGQRLYTGRVAVAQAALEYQRTLFARCKAYSDAKKCWSVKPEGTPLSDIPQLQSLYEEQAARLEINESFVSKCEAELVECLRNDQIPSPALAEAIATAKVRAVESSIELCFRLKQELGSYALMEDGGFKHMDFLQACKFAEGDSRILMSKMARDRVKRFAKTGEEDGGNGDAEYALCSELHKAMGEEVMASGDKEAAWNKNWKLVYSLADCIMDRIMSSSPKPEP